MKNKPPYPLESVDNALLLLQMLRDHGRLRVRQAAADLGIAPSTAHRLLAMLVYRDFARQDEDRCYVPGPGLSPANLVGGPVAQQLRQALLPHMDALCDRVGETVNLMVRIGTQTRFLATVESTQVLHVGDRQGSILPACNSSGGKALLAELGREELADLYLAGGAAALDQVPTAADRDRRDDWPPSGDGPLTPTQFRRLVEELDGVRERGHALNLEGTEAGVCAIGRCVYDAAGRAVAAVTVAVPSVRFTKDRIPSLAAELRRATDRARAHLPVAGRAG